MSAPSNTRGKTTRQRRRRQEPGRQATIAQALPMEPAGVNVVPAPRLARATEPVAPIVSEGSDADSEALLAQDAQDTQDAQGRSSAAADDVTPPVPQFDVRQEFSAWLRDARQAKGMSLEAMAQKTRIQVRVLTCLESAQFDALHADVFVRGYLRSYAQCVGLAAADVLAKYAACGIAPCPVSAPEAQTSGQQVVAPPPTLNMRFGAASSSFASQAPASAAAMPATPSPAIIAPPVVERAAAVAPIEVVDASVATAAIEPALPSTQGKKMPRPHLVIDDANPDLAVRSQRKNDWGEDKFSSPFLRGDREPKQGGLTLAVIVLLVAATIALSYLMKTAPSRGVTLTDAAGELVG